MTATINQKQQLKSFGFNQSFIDLIIDRNYDSNWSYDDILLLHSDKLIGITFQLTIKALNGTQTRNYQLIELMTSTITANTIGVEVIDVDTNQPASVFFIRKDVKTNGGITLNGLLNGYEEVEMRCNVIFRS